jgi:hypothetical protein
MSFFGSHWFPVEVRWTRISVSCEYFVGLLCARTDSRRTRQISLSRRRSISSSTRTVSTS